MYAKKLLKNRDILLAFGLLILSLSISLIGLYNGHDWGRDFSQYLAQARAIATNSINEWQEKNLWIITNCPDGLGAITYPWLFPILITPIYCIFGLNFIPYQVFLSFTFAFCC